MFEFGQLTFRRLAVIRHDAKEPARRHAGEVDQRLKMFPRRKAFAQFPRVHGRHGKTQAVGDFLERHLVLPPPSAERGRKARADVAVKGCGGLLEHSGF